MDEPTPTEAPPALPQKDEPEPIVFASALPGDAEMDAPQQEDVQPEEAQGHTLTTGNNTESRRAALEERIKAKSTSSIPPPPPAEAIVTTLTTTFLNRTTRDWHAKYFLPVESAPPPTAFDLPESYFAPTPTELQTAFAGQVKKREDLTERPLMTRVLREREEALKSRQKAARWPQTRIRVRFGNRSMLEGVFPSTDKLGAIYEFVKASLAEEVKQERFVLYQTPPRTEYKRADPAFKGKNLMDLQFTPSSIFYIKFENDALNDASIPPPLVSSLLSTAAVLPLPPPFDPTKDAEDKDKGNGKEKVAGGQKLGFGGSSGKVVPSWLKVGKKK